MQVEEIVCYDENMKINLLSCQDRRMTAVFCVPMVRLPPVSWSVLLVLCCSGYTGTQLLIQVAETASGNLWEFVPICVVICD